MKQLHAVARCAAQRVVGKDTYATFPILGPSSLPVKVAQPDKRHANNR